MNLWRLKSGIVHVLVCSVFVLVFAGRLDLSETSCFSFSAAVFKDSRFVESVLNPLIQTS